MKPEIFIFQNQRWVAPRPAEMSLSLAAMGQCAGKVFLHLEASFLPEWVMELPEGRDTEEDHRKMHLSIHEFLPPLENVFGLEGLVLEDAEEVTGPDGSVLSPGMSKRFGSAGPKRWSSSESWVRVAQPATQATRRARLVLRISAGGGEGVGS